MRMQLGVEHQLATTRSRLLYSPTSIQNLYYRSLSDVTFWKGSSKIITWNGMLHYKTIGGQKKDFGGIRDICTGFVVRKSIGFGRSCGKWFT
ncbi:hypothetical protein NPIL_88241 [Nephila pilipes]|uniref:Uncharacterized protein n=1 Tax=Nephila pilipes TaxID=299642 RepID=A0A8X6UBT2_NEPPI|nr:hypothetical protein NPIL_88241 [Nephila pilipes]